MDFKLPNQFKGFFRKRLDVFKDPTQAFYRRKQAVVGLGREYVSKAKELRREAPLAERAFPQFGAGRVSEKFFPEFKTPRTRLVEAPEEEAFNLALQAGLFFEGGVQPRGRMTPRMAREILKVKKGASQSQIKTAYKNLLEKEFPKRLVDLAKRRQVNVANLIWEATDALLPRVIPKPEPLSKKLPVRPDTTKPLAKMAEKEVAKTSEMVATGKLRPDYSQIPPGAKILPDKIHYEYRGRTLAVPLGGEKVGLAREITKQKPKTTIAKLEKELFTDKLNAFLTESPSQEEYVKRLGAVEKQLERPEIKGSRQKLNMARATLVKQIKNLTGYEMGRNYKENYSILQTIKQNPELEGVVDKLESLIFKIDEMTGGRVKKKIMEATTTSPNLPAEGKYYIPYGKYTTRGTGNREWVQQTVPLVYMGNKRQMVGYLLNALDVKQTDLGNIVPADVKHLGRFKNVYDLFGGSGLLTSLSKKLFPKAKFHYNELDLEVINALRRVKTNPKPVQKFIAQVGRYLADNPGADWLSHFKLLYKKDPDFRVAAKLIEAAAGRTQELTPTKLSNLVKSVPSFSKIFKGVNMTNRDALKVLDRLAKTGKSSDFVWIDPPYLWSSGYAHGAEMERAKGFLDLLDKLEALDRRGVKFVFTNNDPEVQVAKAGTEAVHLRNIMGRLNQLTRNMVIIHGVKPIGTSREEIIITNLPEAKKSLAMLVQSEVEKRLKKLFKDPAAAPKEMLKFWRDIRGSSRLVPEGEKITPHQIRTIRSLRKRLRVKNREMLPVLDDLLGDVSFAKMTREDGKKMIEWLQPRNWEVIENKIAMVREMQAEERRRLAVGEKFATKQEDLEKKYGVMGEINQTVDEIANFALMIKDLPSPEPVDPSLLKSLAMLSVRHLSEGQATKLLGIKNSFHVPMRGLINISKNYEERMKRGLSKITKDLSKAEQEQVAYLQGGAKKLYKGKISKRAKAVAKYLQEVSEANIAIVNRLREARKQPPLKVRKPYLPYIVEENIRMAASLFDRTKFWEQRTKTPRDFAVGLFEKDLDRIFDAWSRSSANWLKKNLYGAFLLDRYEAVTRGSGPAKHYVKEMVDLDIYDLLSPSEKFYRSIGNAINQKVGTIIPKKVPVDEELAKSILNTSFGKELADNIKNGYLEVPRIQLPNIGDVFVKVFYPAKLAWNWSFALLNRTQPMAAIPFIGTESKLAGRIRLYGSMFPWNRKTRADYIRVLEESGYAFGRIMAGQEIPKLNKKLIKFFDQGINFLGDITELANRLENMFGFEYYLTKKVEPEIGVKISSADKKRMAAQFSAFINFLSGKGYSPLAQRSLMGRFLYVFQQYPINQLEVISEMIRVSFKDSGTQEFLKILGREGGISPKAIKAFDKMSSKSKANLFNIFLALALPVATLYALTRSWNIASRALPSMPRIAISDLASSVFSWLENPTSDEARDRLIDEWKAFTRVTAVDRLKDALSAYDYGLLQSHRTGRPVFVDQNIKNAAMLYLFGRSSLEEYEKAYPSLLGRVVGGQRAASELDRLREEMKDESRENREAAVKILKMIRSKMPSDKIAKELAEMKKSGKLNEKVTKRLKAYLEEEGRGQGMLERGIIGLNDRQQAKFVLDKIFSKMSTEELARLLKTYKEQKILTDNVKKEMKTLLKEGYGSDNRNLFEGFFRK